MDGDPRETVSPEADRLADEFAHRTAHPMAERVAQTMFDRLPDDFAGTLPPITDPGSVIGGPARPPLPSPLEGEMAAIGRRLNRCGAGHVTVTQCGHGWGAVVRIPTGGRAAARIEAHGHPTQLEALEVLAERAEAVATARPKRPKPKRGGR